jgi:hypothetical protein
MNPVSTDAPNRKTTVVLWVIQVLLALLFLFAGGAKLVMPIEELTKGTSLPGLFLRFIGVAEVLGAIGLILPGLLRIRRDLTPLAAAGLVTIMVGSDGRQFGRRSKGRGRDYGGGGASRRVRRLQSLAHGAASRIIWRISSLVR